MQNKNYLHAVIMIFIIAYKKIKFYYFGSQTHIHTYTRLQTDDVDGIKSDFCENLIFNEYKIK